MPKVAVTPDTLLSVLFTLTVPVLTAKVDEVFAVAGVYARLREVTENVTPATLKLLLTPMLNLESVPPVMTSPGLTNAAVTLARSPSDSVAEPLPMAKVDEAVPPRRVRWPDARGASARSGTTLAERLSQGPLGVLDALAIAHDVALGLRAIHECGLLHLDVEPGNVKLPGGEEPRAVLAYTGFARSARVATSRELMADAAHYASPEEAGVLHRRIDERSDIYSAGCMLFESLYGHPPFDGASVNEVLRAQLSGGRPCPRAASRRAPCR